MKIALVSTAAIPTRNPVEMGYGGIEALCWYLSKQLIEEGHKVTLFASKGSDSLGGELVVANEELELNNNAFSREEEFDVIHQWSHHKPTRKDLCKKTCSSVFFTDEIGPNPVFSSYQVAEVMGHPGAKVIYPGIDPNAYNCRNDREDWFLFFNRISSFKGPDIAVRLARRMGFTLKIAGHDGFFAERDYAAAIKDLCDGKQIQYLGEKSFKEKVDLLSRARALIFPFRWLESFSLVTVEALMSGCPVICTSSGGPREIVQDGSSGFLCSSFDEFVSAIKSVDRISSRDCVSRGAYFTSARMTRDYLNFYEKLIGAAK